MGVGDGHQLVARSSDSWSRSAVSGSVTACAAAVPARSWAAAARWCGCGGWAAQRSADLACGIARAAAAPRALRLYDGGGPRGFTLHTFATTFAMPVHRKAYIFAPTTWDKLGMDLGWNYRRPTLTARFAGAGPHTVTGSAAPQFLAVARAGCCARFGIGAGIFNLQSRHQNHPDRFQIGKPTFVKEARFVKSTFFWPVCFEQVRPPLG